MITPVQLRSCVAAVVGDDLGQYARPNLSNAPSIWVWDRPLPSDYKVIKATSLDDVLIPCFEAIIDPTPTPRQRSRQTRGTVIDWLWSITVVQHDRRQLFQSMIERFYCHFRQLEDPIYLEGTDLYPAQLQWRIPFIDFIEVE